MCELATQLQATHKADHDRLDEAFAATRRIMGDEPGSPGAVEVAELRNNVDTSRTAAANAERERDEEPSKLASTEAELDILRNKVSQTEAELAAVRARSEADAVAVTEQRARADRLLTLAHNMMQSASASHDAWVRVQTAAVAAANGGATSRPRPQRHGRLSALARRRPKAPRLDLQEVPGADQQGEVVLRVEVQRLLGVALLGPAEDPPDMVVCFTRLS